MFHVKHLENMHLYPNSNLNNVETHRNPLFHVKQRKGVSFILEAYVCTSCPRLCSATRGETGNGFCRMGADPIIARAAPHYDEEPIISGNKGSGAVFFSGCALRCKFCQNYPISHDGFGKRVSVEHLHQIYFELIEKGVHNINLVNPTHFSEAIYQSLEGGLPVPVLWNSGGYERIETIQHMDGRIQVYLPDLKYINPESAQKYSRAQNYFDYAAPALKEMLRQTGAVELDEDGLIKRGTIVRHLILPGCVDESKRILDWIAENMQGAWISLMAQYLPFGNVEGIDQLNRRLTQQEYEAVVDHLMDLGLEDGFVQELSSSDEKYIPSFDFTGL